MSATIVYASDPTYFQPASTPWGGPPGGQPHTRFNNAGDLGTFSIGGGTLPAGAYLVGVWWTLSGNRSTATVHQVYDGAALQSTTAYDQTQDPSYASVLVSDSGVTFASLGFNDVASGTLKLVIHTPDANYAIADTVLIQRVGPVGYRGPLPAGYTTTGITTLTYKPNDTDGSGASLLTVKTYGAANILALMSPTNDSFSGDILTKQRFKAAAYAAASQVYLGQRCDSTLFHNGYYLLLGLSETNSSTNAAITIERYNAGATTSLSASINAGVLNASHDYEVQLQTRSAPSGATTGTTVLTVEGYLWDVTANVWLDEIGNFTGTTRLPFATTVDDPQSPGSYGSAQITGAGRVVFARYSGAFYYQASDEAYTVAAAIVPGITPYTSIITGQFKYDTSGNPLQLHSGRPCWDPVTRLYYHAGWDCTGLTAFHASDYYPPSNGCNLYSTPDFVNWTFIRKACTSVINGLTYDITLRPHIERHPTNGYFYLYVYGIDFALTNKRLVILRSTDPRGPYVYFNVTTVAGNMEDFDIFVDNDGSAILLVAGQVSNVLAYALLSDWSDITGVSSSITFTGMPGGVTNVEAPAMWRVGSTYYLMVSSTTGWGCNANQITKASGKLGPFAACPYPFTTTNAPFDYTTSYHTQVASVIVTPAGQTVWMGDGWTSRGFLTTSQPILPVSYDGSGNPTIPWRTSWIPTAAPLSLPSFFLYDSED